MTSVLNGPEILIMLTSSILLGGGTGTVTGSIIKRLLSQFTQPLKADVLLGIVGYWAGAYIFAVIWQVVTGEWAVVNIFLAASLFGSAAMTVIGSIGITSLRRMLFAHARSNK